MVLNTGTWDIIVYEMEIKVELPQVNFSEIRALSIDYATNSVNGFIGEQDVVLFCFGEYGLHLDNRYCGHDVVLKGNTLIITKR
jgi:hypothetical protein